MKGLTFDDVLIIPQFSDVYSRKDVDLSFNGANYPYMSLPIISANMDTVTGPEMAKAMLLNGGMGCLHRFCTIDENVKMLEESLLYATGESVRYPFVSIGLGNNELDRAYALFNAGAWTFVIDVAHGAQMEVVKQVKRLRNIINDNGAIIVGNFAGSSSVSNFLFYLGNTRIDGIKVGIGPGSACTTRVKTGVGYPQINAIWEIAHETQIPIIADGGMKASGDIAKAFAAGASMAMLGSLLAGTDEAPGEIVYTSVADAREFDGLDLVGQKTAFKKYRGSASKESYESQGKNAAHRTAEGESFMVPYKGPVKEVLQDIEGGLRSAFTYVGARNLKEFQEKAKFVEITNAGYSEGLPHGKK
ncbi:unnamed protein product [Sphagnum balticum]